MDSPIPLKEVFLTFDDGPQEPYTAQLLDVLKREKVPATFFVCGKNVKRHPGLARRIIAEGHSIGNHSYSHNFVKGLLGMLKKEIAETNEIIAQTTGQYPRLFRPPWGLVPPWLITAVGGMKLVLWDVSAADWKKPGVGKIVTNVCTNIKPGDVVLLHDGQETKTTADRSQTVAAVPPIIQKLRAQGFRFSALT